VKVERGDLGESGKGGREGGRGRVCVGLWVNVKGVAAIPVTVRPNVGTRGFEQFCSKSRW
jgi:hypothetical protein